ncbi:MAG TPA: teichoic acid transporter [Cyanobacteria bacterium UBA11149]|nr:teichoic acid transporter [Cyanobacteria bacterium UBA11367]HBE59901.1 teichoic acid transporter [Cyanobacteria bacterium UBA11366]HBR75857.1 teichoic acid transporter [Cyanobacteria bacterium UBA11159]HBS69279.1 teichoic acid transporter [Cyanobacteria bacterium UBA11153]HBW90444.1 teichoic acid transporter [Cyanobacteria bacterium UBA11149]HCA96634.1 teichoic acid transporter [Cyanobacteria bacterium UBA9226]
MTQSSFSQTQKNTTLEALAKDAGVALIIQIGGLFLTYLLQVVLARWMGRGEYGIYEYVIAWSLFLAIPAGLGLPRAVLRSISQYRVVQDWGHLRGIIRGSWLLTLLSSLLVSLIAAGIVLLLNRDRNFLYAVPLLTGLGLISLQALQQLQLETSRAMDDITLAYLPYQIMWPVLVICGGFVFLETHHSLKSSSMIGVATLMLLVIVLFQLFFIGQKVKEKVESAAPRYAYRQWLSLSLILLVQRAFFIILDQTDIIMVGSFIGPEATGVYNAAVKTALWVTCILEMLNMVVAPTLATLYAQKNMEDLQKVVSKVSLWIFWPSVVIALILLSFTQPILRIFGPGFIGAAWSLKVLVLGRLVDCFCGSVAPLMVMTGNQNKSLPVFASCALLNIVGNAIAIPMFGIVGAAISTTCTLVLWNVWLSLLVVKHVRVNPSIFYSLFSAKSADG